MITETVFITLIAVAAGLLIYAVWDTENRIYGNIIAALLSALLFMYTGAVSIFGTVQTVTPILNDTTWNETTAQTFNIYVDHGIRMYDASLGWLLIVIGLIVGVVTILYLKEAIYEQRMEEAV